MSETQRATARKRAGRTEEHYGRLEADRNARDDQLLATFSRCQDLLCQLPLEAASRADLRENVRARLRVIVKRILRKLGHPPDKQEDATETVFQEAEMLSAA